MFQGKHKIKANLRGRGNNCCVSCLEAKISGDKKWKHSWDKNDAWKASALSFIFVWLVDLYQLQP